MKRKNLTLKQNLARLAFSVLLLFSICNFAGCTPTDTITEDIYTTGHLYSWNGTAWIDLTQQIVYSLSVNSINVTGDGEYDLNEGSTTNITGLFYGDGSILSAITKPSGDIVGTSDNQELTNKTIDSAIAKGTWTNSGEWVIPEVTTSGTINLNHDIDLGSIYMYAHTTGSDQGIIFRNYSPESIGGKFFIQHISESPAVNDRIAAFWFGGRNDAEQDVLYGSYDCYIADETDGTEDGWMRWTLSENGIANVVMQVTSDGTFYIDGTYQTMDKYDDAIVLSRGFRDDEKELLVDVGVLMPSVSQNGTVNYMVNTQSLLALITGGVYQNRDKIDALNIEVEKLKEAILLK